MSSLVKVILCFLSLKSTIKILIKFTLLLYIKTEVYTKLLHFMFESIFCFSCVLNTVSYFFCHIIFQRILVWKIGVKRLLSLNRIKNLFTGSVLFFQSENWDYLHKISFTFLKFFIPLTLGMFVIKIKKSLLDFFKFRNTFGVTVFINLETTVNFNNFYKVFFYVWQ